MRPRKPFFDEDLLIELVARNELTHTEIAKRLGIGRHTVWRILNGRRHPDLRDRIEAARDVYRKQAVRRAAQSARRQAKANPPVLTPYRKNRRYDEDLLVELLAAGNRTYRQIGRRVGLAATTVYKIASGQNRKDLQPRIRAGRVEHQRRAQRIAGGYLRALLQYSIRRGLEGDDELARRCRENVIDRVWMDDDDLAQPEPNVCPYCRGLGETLAQLPPDLAGRVHQALDLPDPPGE